MTKLYFDNQKGIILLNGLPVKSPAFADKEFVIEYFPFDKNLMCVKHAVDCRLTSFEDMLVIKHDDSLIIKFCPLRIHEYDDCYISKQIKCGDTVHILTCKADREHKIILESQYEIINIPLPAKADDVSIKAKTISSGQLLLIKAIIGKKIFCAVVHYNDDYTLLMKVYCDKAYCSDGNLIVEDRLYDCLQRTCVRTLKFCDDAFVEVSRHFEYDGTYDYPDELAPYVFLESIKCKDEDALSSLMSLSMKDCDIYGLFGDFLTICDCVEYRPYRVTLIYSGKNGFFTRTYVFEVKGGRINCVNCV